MKQYERYNKLRDLTNDLYSCVINNDFMRCKLEAIKELLEKKIEDINNEQLVGDSYENGYLDAISSIKNEIDKIIEM